MGGIYFFKGSDRLAQPHPTPTTAPPRAMDRSAGMENEGRGTAPWAFALATEGLAYAVCRPRVLCTRYCAARFTNRFTKADNGPIRNVVGIIRLVRLN